MHFRGELALGKVRNYGQQKRLYGSWIPRRLKMSIKASILITIFLVFPKIPFLNLSNDFLGAT